MSDTPRQHWLFGPELLKALIAAEVIPTMTQRAEIVADHDEFVIVRAEIAMSAEQWSRVGSLLAERQREGRRRDGQDHPGQAHH